jgi:hypothetical protein
MMSGLEGKSPLKIESGGKIKGTIHRMVTINNDIRMGKNPTLFSAAFLPNSAPLTQKPNPRAAPSSIVVSTNHRK